MKKFIQEYFSMIGVICSFILVAIIGSYFTSINMDWYFSLNLPPFAPSGFLIGMIWTVIYILIFLSALTYFVKVKKDKEVFLLFIVNAIFNLSWTILFFYLHLELLSIIEMIFLNITTIFLMYMMFKKNIFSSLVLVPYVLWVGFATYLTYMTLVLN